jgi:hypothetical protein
VCLIAGFDGDQARLFGADEINNGVSGASLADLHNLIDRVTIGRTAIQIQLSEAAEAEAGAKSLQGVANGKTGARPMCANARAILVDALGDAHRWLDELLSDP